VINVFMKLNSVCWICIFSVRVSVNNVNSSTALAHPLSWRL